MALTTEDLRAIAQIVKAETAPMNQRLDTMQADISGMKGDITGMQGDIKTMQATMGTMQADIVTLQGDVRKLNQTVTRIENDHGKKIGLLYDAHVDTLRNAATIKTLYDKVDSHDHRIFALELAVKK